jgi:hypothetical protein
VLAEVASWDLIAQLVELGAGQGLLPDFHKTTRRKNIVKVFEQYPGDPYEVKIYAQPNSSNKLMGFLLERLKKRIPPVLNKKPQIPYFPGARMPFGSIAFLSFLQKPKNSGAFAKTLSI